MRIILASQSPRRKELLEQIGVTFEVMPAKGDEIKRYNEPQKVVEDLSLQKATEIFQKEYGDLIFKTDISVEECKKKEDFLIIGSDTVVAYDDKILGKPKDEVQAMKMLSLLQGKSHRVYTGVTLIYKKEDKVFTDIFHTKTKVRMYAMSKEEIKRYIATKEPMDKAGAYAIQGICASFIKKIDGDYNTVVGLPVAQIYQHHNQFTIYSSS